MPQAHGRVKERDGFPQANKPVASSERILKLTPSRMLAFIAAHGNKADKAKSSRQKKTNVCKWVEKTPQWQMKPLNATTGLVHGRIVQDDLQGGETWWNKANWGMFVKKSSVWCKENLWSCMDEPLQSACKVRLEYSEANNPPCVPPRSDVAPREHHDLYISYPIFWVNWSVSLILISGLTWGFFLVMRRNFDPVWMLWMPESLQWSQLWIAACD